MLKRIMALIKTVIGNIKPKTVEFEDFVEREIKNPKNYIFAASDSSKIYLTKRLIEVAKKYIFILINPDYYHETEIYEAEEIKDAIKKAKERGVNIEIISSKASLPFLISDDNKFRITYCEDGKSKSHFNNEAIGSLLKQTSEEIKNNNL